MRALSLNETIEIFTHDFDSFPALLLVHINTTLMHLYDSTQKEKKNARKIGELSKHMSVNCAKKLNRKKLTHQRESREPKTWRLYWKIFSFNVTPFHQKRNKDLVFGINFLQKHFFDIRINGESMLM